MEVHTAPESMEVTYVNKIHWLPVVVPETLGFSQVNLSPDAHPAHSSAKGYAWLRECVVPVSAAEVMGFRGLKLTLSFSYAEREISQDIFLWREGTRIIGANGPTAPAEEEKEIFATDVPVGNERLWVYLSPRADVQCIRTEPTLP